MYSWENPLNEALYNGNAERYEIDFEEFLEHIKTIAVFIGYSPKTVEKYLGDENN